ncbi:hypothetical protein LOK49_LG04G00370 [Camellia lanceoleosa]|uniref:Uncharacterized protein n=1 Tax=Camellia lanceoleosa TaxID=1840588 RepID=A0ACC0I0R3_9ERIC|nr:hypothetical protein LOK49_LG04G00370 [Camellia lanceoleosa]
MDRCSNPRFSMGNRGYDRFKEPKVAEKYRMVYRNRTVKCEGNVVMDDFVHLGLKQMFEERGWLEICQGHEFATKELVREFYSNLYDWNHKKVSAKGYLRGLRFEFTPDTIATFYHLPRVPNSGFPYAEDDLPSATTVIQELCCSEYNGGDKVSHQEMTLKARMLDKIVASSIIIPSSYTSNPSADTTLILYALFSGVQIDLAYCMWDAIFRVAWCPNGTEGLPFGSFITRWARSMGVPIGPDEEKQAKNQTINKQTERFSLAYVPRRDDTPTDVHQEVKGIVDLESPIEELMTDIKDGISALHNDMVKFWAKFPGLVDALRHDMGLHPGQRCSLAYVPRRDDVKQEVRGGLDVAPQSTIQELMTSIQAGLLVLHNDLVEFWAEFRGEIDALRRDKGLSPRQRFNLKYVPRIDDTLVDMQPTVPELLTCIQVGFAALRNGHDEFVAEFQVEIDALRDDMGLPPG